MKHIILSALLLSSVFTFAKPLQVSGLRVDHGTNPEGVNPLPSLSWNLKSDERAKRQVAYQILAATTEEKLTEKDADLWNSKKQKSAQRHLVQWREKALKDGQKVYWTVRVWDEDEKPGPWAKSAHFVVGSKRILPKPTRISGFESSSPELNALYQDSLKVLEKRLAAFAGGNAGGLGTGAEVQRATRAMLYHFDALPHLTEWIRMMDASMTGENYFPIHPGTKTHGTVSSDAGITVNHPLWWMGGDAKLVEKRWKTFEKYMMAREEFDKSFKGISWGEAMKSEGVPVEFLNLCSLGLTTRFTRDLAGPAQQPLNVIRFKDYAARIRVSFGELFLNKDGSLKVKSQTAHLMALRSAVLTREQQKPVIDALLASLKKEGPQVGPIGAYFLPGVLTVTGNQDFAVEILSKLGKEERKAFLGNGVSGWTMTFLAGIEASKEGFQQILIAPRIPDSKTVTWVKAHYDSPSGRTKVHWEKQDDKGLKVNITIPAGVMARIILPTKKGWEITESGKAIKEAQGVAIAGQDDNAISLISQSGSYSFELK